MGASQSQSAHLGAQTAKADAATLVVATINVQMLEHGDPDRLGRVVYGRLGKAHVICVQEDLCPGGINIPHYNLVAQCTGETIYMDDKRLRLCNSIFVRKGLRVKDVARVELPTGHGLFVPRCAVLCTVRNVRIANVHLTGGRYDDPQAHLQPDIKNLQIQRLLDCDKPPDIVVGDLNGEPGPLPDSVRAYERSLPTRAALRFPTFFAGGHETLEKAGFTPALSKYGKPFLTSVFHTSPDWIYYRPRRGCAQLVGHLSLVPFTKPPVASDHDALLARFTTGK